jgi:hypothetical protein
MTYPVLLIHDVNILKPAVVTSAAGDESYSWKTPASVPAKAWINPQKVFESEDPLRDSSKMVTEIFLAPSASITNEDRIAWGTRTFEAIGEPKFRYTPRGLHHLEVKAVEYDG